jgi:hypothetical protein
MADKEKAASASPPNPKDLNPGELREQLQLLDTEIIEMEKKVQQLAALKAENEVFQQRLRNLQRAFFGLLHHAANPSDELVLKRKIAVLSADMEHFQPDPGRA